MEIYKYSIKCYTWISPSITNFVIIFDTLGTPWGDTDDASTVILTGGVKAEIFSSASMTKKAVNTILR